MSEQIEHDSIDHILMGAYGCSTVEKLDDLLATCSCPEASYYADEADQMLVDPRCPLHG